MKLQQIKDDTFFITLPKSIVFAKGWKKGDEIKCRINEKGELMLYQ